MSDPCKECPGLHFCYEPCEEVIGWEPLPPEMRIKHDDYVPSERDLEPNNNSLWRRTWR